MKNMKSLEQDEDLVLAAIKRLKQAELNDELWCDGCNNYYPSQQVELNGHDWLCHECSLKRPTEAQSTPAT